MAYATPDDLQTYMGQPVDQAQASLILQLVSDEIDGYLGRSLLQQEYEDALLDGPVPGSSTLVLPGYPVASIAALSVLRTPTEWVALAENDDFLWSANGIVIRVFSAYQPDNPVAPFWPRYPRGIKISYTAGYTADALPGSVRAVCLSAAARLAANPAGLRAERIGSYEVQFATSTKDVAGGVQFNSLEEMALSRLREVITA